jgi:hypothetical protein
MIDKGWDYDELDCPEWGDEANIQEAEMIDWLLCDLHIHTKFSDGTMEIDKVIDYYGKLNFDVIAITDHLLDSISLRLPSNVLPYNWIKNEKEFDLYYHSILEQAERAKKEYDMLVIPGIEFTNYIANIHVVGLDIKQFIEVDPKMVQTMMIAKSHDMLLIGAHPHDARFYKLGGGLWRNKEVSPFIDVWEAGNGIDFFPHVVSNGNKIIANTDFHGVLRDNGIRGWKTLIKSKKTIKDVKEAIMKQRIAIHKFREDDLQGYNL